jgi:stage II sporulation protein M
MSFKRWFILALIIFTFAIAVGVVTAPNTLPDDIIGVENIDEIIELPLVALLLFILFKNGLAFLLSFALAPIMLLMPLAALFFNGWVVGVVSVFVLQEQSFGVLLAGILPHGIIEIPAFLLAEGAALSFGTVVIMGVFSQEKRGKILPSFRQNGKYLAVALLLLIPAALVEVFVTPLLIGWAGG